jgi:hypothetical protein
VVCDWITMIVRDFFPEDTVADTVNYQSELFSGAWQDQTLRPEVRYKLLSVTKHFLDYLELENFKLLDVVLTGSMANYNWTRYSDFDVHIITDYADLDCDDLAAEFYHAKKKIWNAEHDVLIRGHEVEMYVEDVNNPPTSAGVYSILDNVWIKKPSADLPDVDVDSVRSKVLALAKQIELAVDSADDHTDIDRIIKKIYQMRRAGLEQNGEFSVENLAFKVLRNQGTLDGLRDIRNQKTDQALSLDENFQDGQGPGRPGDSARAGIPKNATLSQLKKIRSSPSSSARKKQLAHWQINMRQGRAKKSNS